MISLKQHAISLAAVFMALAIGVILGSQTLASGLLSGLRDDKSDLQHQVDALQSRNNQLQSEAVAADGFDMAMSAHVLHDVLAQRTVVVFTTPDADPSDVDGVTKSVAAAGGSVSAKVALTDAFLDSNNADRLRTTLTSMIPAGLQLRTGAIDEGSLAGDFLGAILQVNPQSNQPQSTPAELALALDTLRGGGFIAYGTDPLRPAQLALVVTGEGTARPQGHGASTDDGNRGSIVARFAAALRARGGGTVLVGRPGSANGTGPVAVVRSDPSMAAAVSTVDNVDREAGRITAALALREQAGGGTGRYGSGPKATAVTVGTPTGP